jgi:hypothetical protein
LLGGERGRFWHSRPRLIQGWREADDHETVIITPKDREKRAGLLTQEIGPFVLRPDRHNHALGRVSASRSAPLHD